ncbi:hypothetical protein NGA_0383100, partial [Nannochloropsis gaditana CCMP526]
MANSRTQCTEKSVLILCDEQARRQPSEAPDSSGNKRLTVNNGSVANKTV